MTKLIFFSAVNRCYAPRLFSPFHRLKGKRSRNRIFRSFPSYLFLLWLGFALVLLLLHPGRVGAQQQQDDGLKFYNNEQYAKAVEAWQAELATSPTAEKQALLYTCLCLAYQHLGRLQEAQSASDRSFQLLAASDNTSVRAKAWNTLAQLEWTRGEVPEALASWEKAQQGYAEARDIAGAMGAQLNQAVALEALGRSYDGNQLLEQLYAQLQQQPPTEVKAKIYRKLGATRRRLGELEKAQKVLEEGVAIANLLPNDTVLGEVELELGNTARSQANQQSAIGKTEPAKASLHKAFQHYARAASSRSTIVQLHANINQLSLAADTGKAPDASLLPKIEALLEKMPVNHTTTKAQLNYAETLSCWQVKIDAETPACTRSEWGNTTAENSTVTLTPKLINTDAIYQLLKGSLRAAETLKSSQFKVAALGQLGALYEQNHQWQEAEVFTIEALKESATKGSEELLYRFSWQLGRLQKKQARKAEALQSYQNAVESLQRVRKDLLVINTDVQFSFRDNVEPVYREYVNLLLDAEGEAKPEQEKLKNAIAAIDQLQLAEIENFLRCDTSTNVQKTQADRIDDPKAAIIYPIITDRGIVTIFKLHGRPYDYRFSAVDPREIENNLSELRNNLVFTSRGEIEKIETEAAKLYNWLFKPLESVLANEPNLDTLAFVLDDPLRNIPMSVLYDARNREYLVQKKYAIAVLPSVKLFAARATDNSLVYAGGGIGIPQQLKGFPTLPSIEELREEIDNIPEPNYKLYDKDFTISKIKAQLQERPISAIHWKTHGFFSSDPEETYLVAYQELIKARAFNELIAASCIKRGKPLQLLILSACSSAEGDKRAVLGLAGIAARSGAQTTISTLWDADEKVTTKFTKYFYQEWKSGVSKAKAMQLAQKQILEKDANKMPSVWAVYVLVGSWF
ncbi:CHAT domain-containing protein [Oscillatoria sp. FACHB-1406]|nr:CHAT domain-containing protein [Oscillatoria sp. FACHB-1406]